MSEDKAALITGDLSKQGHQTENAPQQAYFTKHVSKAIRRLGWAQIVLGVICVVAQITALALWGYLKSQPLSYYGHRWAPGSGIWGGILLIIAGCITLGAARKQGFCLIITCMVWCAIAAAVLGVVGYSTGDAISSDVGDMLSNRGCMRYVYDDEDHQWHKLRRNYNNGEYYEREDGKGPKLQYDWETGQYVQRQDPDERRNHGANRNYDYDYRYQRRQNITTTTAPTTTALPVYNVKTEIHPALISELAMNILISLALIGELVVTIIITVLCFRSLYRSCSCCQVWAKLKKLNNPNQTMIVSGQSAPIPIELTIKGATMDPQTGSLTIKLEISGKTSTGQQEVVCVSNPSTTCGPTQQTVASGALNTGGDGCGVMTV